LISGPSLVRTPGLFFKGFCGRDIPVGFDPQLDASGGVRYYSLGRGSCLNEALRDASGTPTLRLLCGACPHRNQPIHLQLPADEPELNKEYRRMTGKVFNENLDPDAAENVGAQLRYGQLLHSVAKDATGLLVHAMPDMQLALLACFPEKPTSNDPTDWSEEVGFMMIWSSYDELQVIAEICDGYIEYATRACAAANMATPAFGQAPGAPRAPAAPAASTVEAPAAPLPLPPPPAPSASTAAPTITVGTRVQAPGPDGLIEMGTVAAVVDDKLAMVTWDSNDGETVQERLADLELVDTPAATASDLPPPPAPTPVSAAPELTLPPPPAPVAAPVAAPVEPEPAPKPELQLPPPPPPTPVATAPAPQPEPTPASPPAAPPFITVNPDPAAAALVPGGIYDEIRHRNNSVEPLKLLQDVVPLTLTNRPPKVLELAGWQAPGHAVVVIDDTAPAHFVGVHIDGNGITTPFSYPKGELFALECPRLAEVMAPIASKLATVTGKTIYMLEGGKLTFDAPAPPVTTPLPVPVPEASPAPAQVATSLLPPPPKPKAPEVPTPSPAMPEPAAPVALPQTDPTPTPAVTAPVQQPGIALPVNLALAAAGMDTPKVSLDDALSTIPELQGGPSSGGLSWNTGLAQAGECWRKAYYELVMGLQPKHQPDYFSLGTLGHACFEMHYRTGGAKTWDPIEVAIKYGYTELAKDVRRYVYASIRKYGEDERLTWDIRAPELQVTYFAGPFKINGKLHYIPITSRIDLVFALRAPGAPTLPMGTPSSSGIYFLDYKFLRSITAKSLTAYANSGQFKTNAVAYNKGLVDVVDQKGKVADRVPAPEYFGPLAGVVAHLIAKHKEMKDSSMQRVTANTTPELLDEFETTELIPTAVELYSRLASPELRSDPKAWPRNHTACVSQYGVCPFFDVCDVGLSAADRIISEMFEVNRGRIKDPEAFAQPPSEVKKAKRESSMSEAELDRAARDKAHRAQLKDSYAKAVLDGLARWLESTFPAGQYLKQGLTQKVVQKNLKEALEVWGKQLVESWGGMDLPLGNVTGLGDGLTAKVTAAPRGFKTVCTDGIQKMTKAVSWKLVAEAISEKWWDVVQHQPATAPEDSA
jgi:hypothetical protein